jgi:transposase
MTPLLPVALIEGPHPPGGPRGHANARTTVHSGRLLIVQRHQQGWAQAHIAAAMGVSRKCVRTWITRYDAEGIKGLQDRSSRSHRSPTRTREHVEASIVDLRQRERLGPDELSAQLGVPARTVSRVLARHGLTYLAALDPMTGELLRSSKTTAVRYERAYPGALVHMDVKKISRIPDGGGWRAHGRGAQEITQDRRTKVDTTTCTPWSMTTPAWPTPRSIPTRRTPPALAS